MSGRNGTMEGEWRGIHKVTKQKHSEGVMFEGEYEADAWHSMGKGLGCPCG
jgi:hypothetical protein